MAEQTSSPELTDKDRIGAGEALGRIADRAMEGLVKLASDFGELERLAHDLKVEPQLSGVLTELRISAVRGANTLKDLSVIPAVAKVLSNTAKEEQA